MKKSHNGVPSVEMRKFLQVHLPTLGLPSSSLLSLTRFLTNCEAIFAVAIAPSRCQESWGDEGTGYRNEHGEMNLRQVFAQYVHWKTMPTADAQRMIEYESVCLYMFFCCRLISRCSI